MMIKTSKEDIMAEKVMMDMMEDEFKLMEETEKAVDMMDVIGTLGNTCMRGMMLTPHPRRAQTTSGTNCQDLRQELRHFTHPSPDHLAVDPPVYHLLDLPESLLRKMMMKSRMRLRPALPKAVEEDIR